ncbi:hypothetical protein [Streptomyces sp. SCL15-6]|uniref:hypothetical protein n=1 Tax=Streptomyces sp. SCL15-6 TaxID=2967222 RepID=UPI002967547E|nr:hypothetical protein [Streptomyces sp. SCL15-6]
MTDREGRRPPSGSSMRRPGLAPVLVLSAALAVSLTACSTAGQDARRPAGTGPATPQSPAALPSAAAPPALTRAQASAALITGADLGEAWGPTLGAATWRDDLLKATATDPDCRRLLDVLYTEELFGASPAPRATAALDDQVGHAQLHYRITSHRAAGIDRTLAWLATLPDMCGHFTAEAARGAAREVRVTGVTLPEAGDARQGLRVTVTGTTADAGPAVLTVDLVAVRVGDDAISLTNGSLGEAAEDATRTAVEVGAGRLTEIRRQGRAQV